MVQTTIIYEASGYYVIKTAKGFEIYRNGVTSASLAAICGYTGQRGLDWCKSEIERREAL